MNKRTYLDYNATAPLRPESRAAMMAVLDVPHNASAVHGFGREGRMIVERAREDVARLVNAPATQVIFNSGATEGNNTVIKYFAGERILASAIEHPSVLEAAENIGRIPVTAQGVVDLNALEKLLKAEKTALVSVMLVNNETGVIQPVAEISALAKRYGALVHCDAVQAVGRIPVDIAALGVDFMTLSAHKIGGAQGVGALVLGLCGITPVMMSGGGQEKKARAGTENVAGIAAFGAAAKAAVFLDSTLHEKLEDGLKKISPEIVIHGADAKRVPNTIMFSLKGASSETLLMALDLEGIALSNGSACSSGTVKASTVLKAMGLPDDIAGGALRISTGWASTEKDIDALLTAWTKIYSRIGNKVKARA